MAAFLLLFICGRGVCEGKDDFFDVWEIGVQNFILEPFLKTNFTQTKDDYYIKYKYADWETYNTLESCATDKDPMMPWRNPTIEHKPTGGIDFFVNRWYEKYGFGGRVGFYWHTRADYGGRTGYVIPEAIHPRYSLSMIDADSRWYYRFIKHAYAGAGIGYYSAAYKGWFEPVDPAIIVLESRSVEHNVSFLYPFGLLGLRLPLGRGVNLGFEYKKSLFPVKDGFDYSAYNLSFSYGMMFGAGLKKDGKEREMTSPVPEKKQEDTPESEEIKQATIPSPATIKKTQRLVFS
ncbi:MAG: hypothetical protein QME32_07400 [Endomicrobiia bacterium]|nr:hypothetical protein [Endomicrobiia bacterium]